LDEASNLIDIDLSGFELKDSDTEEKVADSNNESGVAEVSDAKSEE
jgi:hypothetical protein